jgi:flagellar basal body-associated protein FliL
MERGNMESNHIPSQHAGNHMSKLSKSNQSLRRLIVAIVVVLVIVIGALVALSMLRGERPASDRYQAVFLDNGQVFFGKLKNTDGKYLRLEKAFYTKKQDLPADATAEQKAATANNVSLIKVGDEVYGPESNINIRAEQVLFWQDLRSDSKVAKAIDAK